MVGRPTGPLCLSSFDILAASPLPAASFAASQISMVPLASPAAMTPSCMESTCGKAVHASDQAPSRLGQELVLQLSSMTGTQQRMPGVAHMVEVASQDSPGQTVKAIS